MLSAEKLTNVEFSSTKTEEGLPQYMRISFESGKQTTVSLQNDKFGQNKKIYDRLKNYKDGSKFPVIVKENVLTRDGQELKFLNSIKPYSGQMLECEQQNFHGVKVPIPKEAAILGKIVENEDKTALIIRTTFYNAKEKKNEKADIPFTVVNEGKNITITADIGADMIGHDVCVIVPVDKCTMIGDQIVEKRVTAIDGIDSSLEMEDLGKTERASFDFISANNYREQAAEKTEPDSPSQDEPEK